jgi:hypothetical protein
MRVINFDYEVKRKDNHIEERPKVLHISYFPFSIDYMLCLQCTPLIWTQIVHTYFIFQSIRF